MGFIAFLKNVRDFLRTRFWHCIPSNGPLASPSPAHAVPVAAPAMMIPPQTIGISTATSDVLLSRSDATEGALTVPTVVDVPTPLLELGIRTLSPVQDVVSFVPEIAQIPSPAPFPEAPTILSPMLTVKDVDGPPLDSQELCKDSGSAVDTAFSTTNPEDFWPASVNIKRRFAMMRPVHRYIPPEITDNIIFSLDIREGWKNQMPLCRFALVCKDWLPASRYSLFRHVIFWKSPGTYDLFVARVLRSKHMRPWLAHVQELSFSDPSLMRTHRWGEDSTEPVDRGYRLVHDFSGRLPNLLQLSIRDVDWSGCPGHPSAYLTFFRQLRHLQVLHLENCRFPSFYAFWRTIVALPSLRDLSLRGAEWPCETARRPIFSREHGHWPKLHTFTFTLLYGPGLHTLLSWLSQAPSPSSIRRLECDALHLAEHPEFCRAVSTSVTEISLPSTIFDNLTLRAEDILSSFSQLQSLELNDVFGSKWGKLAVMLQNLPSRCLRQLIIRANLGKMLTVEAEGNHGIDDEELELLDAVLDRDNFASLESVRFTISADMHQDLDKKLGKSMIVETWKKKLAKLHARGIVEMDHIWLLVRWLSPRDNLSIKRKPQAPQVEDKHKGRDEEEEQRADQC